MIIPGVILKNKCFPLKDQGQGMVEFAMVFPLLLLLLIGIFEVGKVMFSYSIVIAATREAARYGAAIQDIGGGIPQYEDCQGIRDAAKRFGKYAGIDDGDITIQYFNDSGVFDASCPPANELGLTDSISVTVSTSVSPLSMIGNFGTIPITSSSSRTILRKIRLGDDGTGVGSISGAVTDVNFKTTEQTAEETKGVITAVLELNQVATDTVTIPFSVTGTAVKDVDYIISNSPVIINPGQSTTTIYITLINDAIEEGDESLFIGLSSPINATKGPQNIHQVTIVDPPLVSFTLADSIKSEADGTTALNIMLSKGSNQDVIVPIVSGGTATWGAGGDYQTSPNPVIIPAGSLSSMVTITLNNDLIDEPDEIAALGLGMPTHALLGDIPMHLMTIVDDDLPPEISFFTPNQVVSEEIGTFTTVVTLSSISTKTITVPYNISGTAIPADYIIHDPSPLVFPPGVQTVEINMSILEGDGWEEDETLILSLDTPTNATLGAQASQTIVITESSEQPNVYFAASSQSVTEADRIIDVYLRLTNAWSQDVVVPLTISGTAAQGAGLDYEIASSSLTIPVGYTQGVVQVQLHDDLIFEDTETITINMGAVSNATAVAPTAHTISITDNDTAPAVSFDGTALNKNENQGSFDIRLDLDITSTQDITIPLLLSGSATQSADYTISTISPVIPAGSTGVSFTITLIDDANFEPDENIIIDLDNPDQAVTGTPDQFIVNLEDDDLPLCEVGTHMLIVNTDTITWSITNEGEALYFTGGSITWPESSNGKPRLSEGTFDGSVMFTGNEKAPSFTYSAWQNFDLLDTVPVTYSFSESLAMGDHILVGYFQNVNTGETCSLTETYTSH